MARACPRLLLIAALAAASALLLAAPPARAKPTKKTFTYKTVKKLAIKADVYREGDEKKRPVVVWIHGGALINGHREQVPARLKGDALKAGYVFVSIDYRLAPESKLPDVVADVADAL
jgi:acetyl esterase/lipase